TPGSWRMSVSSTRTIRARPPVRDATFTRTRARGRSARAGCVSSRRSTSCDASHGSSRSPASGGAALATSMCGGCVRSSRAPGSARRVLHPEDAVARLVDRRVPRRGDAERQHRARVERIDDAVVPDARGRVVGRPLRLVLLADAGLEALALVLALERADHREDRRGLLAAHHADARVRPHPELPRLVRAAGHAVVPRAEGAADDHGELRHHAARDRHDHLRAVLRDAAALVLLADHESGDVLEEHEWHAALIAEL